MLLKWKALEGWAADHPNLQIHDKDHPNLERHDKDHPNQDISIHPRTIDKPMDEVKQKGK